MFTICVSRRILGPIPLNVFPSNIENTDVMCEWVDHKVRVRVSCLVLCYNKCQTLCFRAAFTNTMLKQTFTLTLLTDHTTIRDLALHQLLSPAIIPHFFFLPTTVSSSSCFIIQSILRQSVLCQHVSIPPRPYVAVCGLLFLNIC